MKRTPCWLIVLCARSITTQCHVPEIIQDRHADGPALGYTLPVKTKTPLPIVPPTPIQRRSKRPRREEGEEVDVRDVRLALEVRSSDRIVVRGLRRVRARRPAWRRGLIVIGGRGE